MKFHFIPAILALCLGLAFAVPASAQKIVYSEKNNDDSRNLNFDIVGKINGNFLIYKNTRARSWISVLDNELLPVAELVNAACAPPVASAASAATATAFKFIFMPLLLALKKV